MLKFNYLNYSTSKPEIKKDDLGSTPVTIDSLSLRQLPPTTLTTAGSPKIVIHEPLIKRFIAVYIDNPKEADDYSWLDYIVGFYLPIMFLDLLTPIIVNILAAFTVGNNEMISWAKGWSYYVWIFDIFAFELGLGLVIGLAVLCSWIADQDQLTPAEQWTLFFQCILTAFWLLAYVSSIFIVLYYHSGAYAFITTPLHFINIWFIWLNRHTLRVADGKK